MALSNSERQRRYRESQKERNDGAPPVTEGAPEEPSVTEEPVTAVTRKARVTREQYMRTVGKEAAAYSDAIGETDLAFKIGEVILEGRKSQRIERARRYAAWRYDSFLAGEVATL